jgi:hypothetical protein
MYQAEDVEDITVDASGNIYLLADNKRGVLKYAPDGRLQHDSAARVMKKAN